MAVSIRDVWLVENYDFPDEENKYSKVDDRGERYVLNFRGWVHGIVGERPEELDFDFDVGDLIASLSTITDMSKNHITTKYNHYIVESWKD